MFIPYRSSSVGVLMSGGLDSAILLARLAEEGHHIQPFYVRSQLLWEHAEIRAAGEFIQTLRSSFIRKLVTLDLPLHDLYQDHWSTTGHAVPDAISSDEAVYLPGRNALLIIKAVLWCQMHNVENLALAVLKGNPFYDARDDFFDHLQAALNAGSNRPVRILRPFAALDKLQVMRLGRPYRLDLTFSCLQPVDGMHCGSCNKCAERQRAFEFAGYADGTWYGNGALV